jgi:hypothetical protein
MSNVIPIGGGGREDSDDYDRKNNVLARIDKARSVVELTSRQLMGFPENALLVDCSCALDLASDELQRVRDLYTALVGI